MPSVHVRACLASSLTSPCPLFPSNNPAALAITPDKPFPSNGHQMVLQPRSHSSSPVLPCDQRLQSFLLHVSHLGSKPTMGDPGTARSNEASPSFLPGISRAVARRNSKGKPPALHMELFQDPAPNALILLIISLSISSCVSCGPGASTASRQQEWPSPIGNEWSFHEAYRYLVT